jgi:hypothetical protein
MILKNNMAREVTKTTDPGYNEFYNFAKRFLKLYPQNAK